MSKLKLVLAITLMLVLLQNIYAKVIEAGITPDSWLYWFDIAMDKLVLALTFDEVEKVKKGLEIARERLAEIEELIEEGNLEKAQIARAKHEEFLALVKSTVKGIELENPEKELEKEIEVELELEKHEKEIELVKNELKVKIEIEGTLTKADKELIDSIFNSLLNKVLEVEVEIEKEENETKVEIEAEGKSREEVEIEIERRLGLLEFRKERAAERIENAEEEILEVVEEIEEENVSAEVVKAIENLLREAEIKLSLAKEAFLNESYGKAFGLATAAKQLAENAERLLEKEEVEIEVEVEEGKAKVEVEVGDAEIEFWLNETSEERIIEEIARKTGLERGKIKRLLEIEVEEEEVEEEVEIEEIVEIIEEEEVEIEEIEIAENFTQEIERPKIPR